MKRTARNLFLMILSISILLGIVPHTAIVSAWGDSANGRPIYSLQDVNEGKLNDKITFNSIEIQESDYDWYQSHPDANIQDLKNVLESEPNFVGARENTGINAGAGNVWNGNEISVEDGKTYLVRLYAHNNNPGGWNAVAEDVKVNFDIEATEKVDGKYESTVFGSINSSNANPTRVYDHVDFQSDHNFHLEYVYGSALLENNGDAAGQLPDSIMEGGTLIGFNSLDGRVPGGYTYANNVTIEVKVVYDYDFMVENKVRLVGEKEWQQSVDAQVGDQVQFLIQYKNVSEETQTAVVLRDTLPSNLRYVESTTKIKNSLHPKWENINEDYLVNDGIGVGSYSSGSNVYLMFTAEVVDDNLTQGSNTLVNWAQGWVGDSVEQEYATIIVQKDKGFYVIVTICATAIVICLVIIAILIRRIIKRGRSEEP